MAFKQFKIVLKLSSFGINEIYSNYSDKIIEKNSLIVYEIKSGKKEKKLINQMMKRCFFIQKYLNNIYDKQIYYIGFFRAKKYNDKKESFEEEKENKDRRFAKEINGRRRRNGF